MFILYGVGVLVGGVTFVLGLLALCMFLGESFAGMVTLMAITFTDIFLMIGWWIANPHGNPPAIMLGIGFGGIILLMLSIGAASE